MRYVVVIVGLLALVGSLVFVKFSQISTLMAFGKEMQAAGPPPEAVSSAVAQVQSWEDTLAAVGNIASVKGVSLSNDAPGVVKRINFESGKTVKKGEVLVELDSSVERAQLASAKARRDLASLTLNRTRALFASKSISQAQLDADDAEFKRAETDYKAISAELERKVVRAPFGGRLGIRGVNLGQYLNPGTTITSLDALGDVYVDFTLPQQRLTSVTIGMPVRVTIEGSKQPPMVGTITAVDPTLDDATRSLKLRASLPNDKDKLRPGMFANVSVLLPKRQDQVIVPITAIVHASYGDSVFVVEDKKPGSPGMAKTRDGRIVRVARQQFVRVGETRGDFVSLLDGVKAGEELVTAGAFKLRNNAPIAVDNKVKAEAQLHPNPENR
jgi:membrane fusion protein (multidrug efflux system)